MPFSENTKLEVKQKANFRCCRCQKIGVHVHHVIPQKDGGSDDIDNAAPLCPSCHDYFGDNPSKRKEIREMRDHWYKIAEKMFYHQSPDLGNLVGKIDELVLNVKENKEQFVNLQHALKEYSNKVIDNITIPTSGEAASGIVNAMFPAFRLTASMSQVVDDTDVHWVDLSDDIGETAVPITTVAGTGRKYPPDDSGETM